MHKFVSSIFQYTIKKISPRTLD